MKRTDEKKIDDRNMFMMQIWMDVSGEVVRKECIGTDQIDDLLKNAKY